MRKDVVIPVILCGGSGSRLWPLSRESYPKQYLSLIKDSKSSLLQNTIKRINKVKIQAMDSAAILNTLLLEKFRNHKLIKVFQKETYETSRANTALEQLKNKGKKFFLGGMHSARDQKKFILQ